jgi:hypothetical protein
MKAVTMFLAGGAAIAALATAAPAAAQFFPGMGSPYGYGVPQANNQVAISQCVNAVQARLGGGYGGYGYGSGYGYGAGGRVLGISRVEPRFDGTLLVRGVASSGRYAGYGYGQNRPDLTWRCRTDFRGFVVDVNVSLAQPAYGAYGPYGGYGAYGPNGYAPQGNAPYNPYSAYGYVRY